VEELALLREATKHDGVKLGAISARVDVIERHALLLRALGYLPRDTERAVTRPRMMIRTRVGSGRAPPQVQSAPSRKLA